MMSSCCGPWPVMIIVMNKQNFTSLKCDGLYFGTDGQFFGITCNTLKTRALRFDRTNVTFSSRKGQRKLGPLSRCFEVKTKRVFQIEEMTLMGIHKTFE